MMNSYLHTECEFYGVWCNVVQRRKKNEKKNEYNNNINSNRHGINHRARQIAPERNWPTPPVSLLLLLLLLSFRLCTNTAVYCTKWRHFGWMERRKGGHEVHVRTRPNATYCASATYNTKARRMSNILCCVASWFIPDWALFYLFAFFLVQCDSVRRGNMKWYIYMWRANIILRKQNNRPALDVYQLFIRSPYNSE